MGIITLVLSQRILIEDPTKSIVNCSRELSIACTGILIFIRIPLESGSEKLIRQVVS